MSGWTTHPTPEELLAYPIGELSETRARAVFNHCSGCEDCGRELATIMELRAEAVAADSMRESSGAWRWVAVAAGVVLLLAAALLGGRIGTELGWGTAASPYAELATQETLPDGYYDFRFGGVRLAGTADQELRDGLLAITETRYDEATSMLESYLAGHPNDREGRAYLGIARYLAGDVSFRTVELLEIGATDARVSRIAAWYLGNAELKVGDLEAARKRFESLAASNDRVGRDSRAMLARLPE